MRQVTIPEALIRRLQPLGPHFIKVAKKGKEPKDEGWTLNPMFATDPQLDDWLKNGGNYGVVGGFGLVIVDTDIEELKKIVLEKLPETFTVQSPGSEGWHCYFHCSLENPIRLRDKAGDNIGDIQGPGKQVVGPGSRHPNGDLYKIIKDVPLAQVTREQLIEAFKEFVVPDKEVSLIQQTATLEKNTIDISILDVVPLEGLHRRGDEYFGSHPIHGSIGGQNFWVNPTKNCWHCFRHGSGGGALLWLAVEENIIDCSEAGPQVLRGQKFNQVKAKAIEKGYIDEIDFSEKKTYDLSKCWTKDNKFQPVWFAEGLMEKYYFRTAESDKIVYVYNEQNGIYTETGDIVIEQEMAKYLSDYNRQPYFRDIQFNIKARTYFARPIKQNVKIACLNGLLNSVTQKFERFTPEEFITIQLPHRYVPNVKCPKIIQFLREVVGEKQINFMQEFMGYCLYPGYPIHRAVMLVGDGENGKSTLINLIQKFLGAENVSSMTLQSFSEDKFSASELYNKLANLSADLPSKTLTNTGMFKMLTGGDPISTARKYKGRIHWINRAKMLFSCNKIPESNDDTRAFFRRWHIIECKNYFPASKRDIKILEKICTPTEMSGLLNWALQGLRRLLENGKFSVAEDHKKVRKHYMRKSNSARAFIEECLKQTLDPNDKIEYNMLYKTFISWCRRNKLPTKKKGALTQNMSQYCSDAECVQERYGKDKKKRRRIWRYIKFVTTVTTPSPKSPEEQKKLGDPLVTPVTENKDPIDEAFSKPYKERSVADLKKW